MEALAYSHIRGYNRCWSKPAGLSIANSSESRIEPCNPQAIAMTLFILKTFSVQDEEVQTIHLPIVFSAIVEALDVSGKHIYFEH
jgi:hypothetical protein